MIEHRNITNLITTGSYVRFAADRTFAQLAPVAFDAATFEIWGALAHGARLAVAPARVVDPGEIAGLVHDEHVTTLWLTAPLFHDIADRHAELLSEVEELLAGGDVVSATHVEKMLAMPGSRTFTNGYGPTETTTFACTHRVSQPAAGISPTVPLGRPIANTRIYVLDKRGNPLPAGVPGELYIGGAGVGRGYLNRPALTAERFVADPFSGVAGARLFRTGDLGRFLPGGAIEFRGRIDHQVKVRGFRIELGEVESVLSGHPAVRECVVEALGDSASRRLAAYLVPRAAQPSAAELRQFAAQTLPGYMVPSVYVVLDALPLTPSGKVDRAALPDPGTSKPATGHQHQPPATDLERLLASLWEETLDVQPVGVNDDFFELGGHSMIAPKLVSRIREAGLQCTIAQLYQFSTPAELAQSVGRDPAERGAERNADA
ncbi:MAG: non-ribosomal peptide synthetase [Streptosporangiaceae bacterium]